MSKNTPVSLAAKGSMYNHIYIHLDKSSFGPIFVGGEGVGPPDGIVLDVGYTICLNGLNGAPIDPSEIYINGEKGDTVHWTGYSERDSSIGDMGTTILAGSKRPCLNRRHFSKL